MAKQPSTELAFGGLHTNANAFSAAKPGEMAQADNIVVRTPDVLEPRRGVDTVVSSATDTGMFGFAAGKYGNIVSIVNYQNYWKHFANNATSSIWMGSTYASTLNASVAITDLGYAMIVAPPGTEYPSSFKNGLNGTSPVSGSGASGLLCDTPFLTKSYPFENIVYNANATVPSYYPLTTLGETFRPSPTVMNNSLFITSANGLVKTGDLLWPGGPTSSNHGTTAFTGASLRSAGVPAPYCPYNPNYDPVGNPCGGTVSATGTLPGYSTVAYRFVLGRYDQNGFLLLSAPSPRIVVTNATATTAYPTLQVFIPYEVTAEVTRQNQAGWFLQVYRTQYLTYGVNGTPLDPGDECFQVYEDTSLSTSGGVYTYVEQQTGAASSMPLYTNANTGNGIVAANTRPPLCRTTSKFRNFGLFGNVSQKQSLDVTLLGASSLTSGVNALSFSSAYYSNGGYVPSLGLGAAFAPSSSNNYVAGLFKLYTSSSVVGQNNEITARNLAYVVNQYFHQDNKSALSAAGQTPPDYNAAIQCEYISDYSDQVQGQLYFQNVYYSAPAFAVTTNSGSWNGAGTSDNSAYVAGVMWSNDSQPEAVPVANFSVVGNPLKPVVKITSIGQSSFIFKKDDGVWQLTGTDPTTFDIREFDNGINLVAPGTVAVLDGTIYCFTLKGIEAFSESGKLPMPVSHPIERELLALRASNPNFDTSAFAFAYESEGLYVLCVPASSSDIGCSLQYVYCVSTNAWTRWTIPNLTAGRVMQFENRMWLGAQNAVKRERKSLTSSDYQDDGAAIISTGQFLPVAPGTIFEEKKFSDVYWNFAKLEPDTITLGMYTDRQTTNSTVSKTGQVQYVFGTGTFGQYPFGGYTQNVALRQDVPQACANGSALSLNFQVGQASRGWQIQGISILSEASTTSLRR